MILTNTTNHKITLNLPDWLDEPALVIPAGIGSNISAPDSLWPYVELASTSFGVVASFGGGGGGAPALPEVNNLSAVVDPTVSDDTTAGYTSGSHWHNTLTGILYIAGTVAAGAAVWTPVTTSSTALQNNYTAITAPTAADDSVAGYAVGSIWIDTLTDKSYVCVDATAALAVWAVTNDAGNKPASTFDVINIVATTAANTPIVAPTVPLGASALVFNGNAVVVLVNGFEQVKGTGVAWATATSFTLGIPLYAGDVLVVKP